MNEDAVRALKELADYAGSANGNADGAKYLMESGGDLSEITERVEWAVEQLADALRYGKEALAELRR